MEYFSAIKKERTIETPNHMDKSPNIVNEEAFQKEYMLCDSIYTKT